MRSAGPRRVAALASLGLAVMGAAGCAGDAGQPASAGAGSGSGSESTPAEPPGPSLGTVSTANRALVWRDDFTGPAGKAPNPAYWTAQIGGEGWGNKELQFYSGHRRNAALDGRGHLAIRAVPFDGSEKCWYGPCRYTSARLTTHHKMSVTRGRAEARMKLPLGKGLWPAFWLLGENINEVGWPACGEIDVMEYLGHEPNRIWGSAHGPGYVKVGLTGPYVLPEGTTYADGFHTFAVDWTDDGLAYSVDDVVFLRVTRAQIGESNTWVFDKPFHILLNLAVGGEWPGEPDAETQFPATVLVDHVAIYR